MSRWLIPCAQLLTVLLTEDLVHSVEDLELWDLHMLGQAGMAQAPWDSTWCHHLSYLQQIDTCIQRDYCCVPQ